MDKPVLLLFRSNNFGGHPDGLEVFGFSFFAIFAS